MPQPRVLPVIEAVFAVTGVGPGQGLHQRLAPEKTGGWVLQAPFAPEVVGDRQAPRNQRSRSLYVPWSARGARKAEVRAGGTCPHKLEIVPRERGLVVSLHYVHAEGGPELGEPVHTRDIPALPLKGVVYGPSARAKDKHSHLLCARFS